MTIQKCLQICRTRGYEFSGLQWQIECYCGDMPSNGFELAWPGKCDERCAGDSSQMCGGSMAMNLYNTPGQKLDGLCVYEHPDKRVFEGPSITGQSDMTIEKCRHYCSEYRFYGVQAGHECHCGDSDYNLLPSLELECNTPCEGNSSQICGGSWRMNVYDSISSRKSDLDEDIEFLNQEEITNTDVVLSEIESSPSSYRKSSRISRQKDQNYNMLFNQSRSSILVNDCSVDSDKCIMEQFGDEGETYAYVEAKLRRFCDSTNWINRDLPKGTGDHENYWSVIHRNIF